MVLCRIDVKHPRLQISESSCVFSLHHVCSLHHVLDLPSIGKLYLMATASIIIINNNLNFYIIVAQPLKMHRCATKTKSTWTLKMEKIMV